MMFSAIHVGAAALVSMTLGFGAGFFSNSLFGDHGSNRLDGMDVSSRVTDPASIFLIDVIRDVESGLSRKFTRSDNGLTVDAKVLMHAVSVPMLPDDGCSGKVRSTERLSYDPPIPLATSNDVREVVTAGYYSSELLIELDNCFLVVKGTFLVDNTGTPTLDSFRVSSFGETREDAVRTSIGDTYWREAQARLRLNKQ